MEAYAMPQMRTRNKGEKMTEMEFALIIGILIGCVIIGSIFHFIGYHIQEALVAEQWCDNYGADVIKYAYADGKFTELICKTRYDDRIFEIIEKDISSCD